MTTGSNSCKTTVVIKTMWVFSPIKTADFKTYMNKGCKRNSDNRNWHPSLLNKIALLSQSEYKLCLYFIFYRLIAKRTSSIGGVD